MGRFNLVVGAMVVAAQSFGAYQGPLLELSRTPGYTLPAYRVGLRCEIHHNKVVLHRSADNVVSTETRPLELKVGPLLNVIDGAAKGELDETVGPTDGPTTTYTAIQIMPNDSIKRIVLDSKGDIIVKNKALEAMTLKNFIDLHCK